MRDTCSIRRGNRRFRALLDSFSNAAAALSGRSSCKHIFLRPMGGGCFRNSSPFGPVDGFNERPHHSGHGSVIFVGGGGGGGHDHPAKAAFEKHWSRPGACSSRCRPKQAFLLSIRLPGMYEQRCRTPMATGAAFILQRCGQQSVFQHSHIWNSFSANS